MNRVLFFMAIAFPIVCFGPIENRWQPDSIYANRQVKKILVYLNSPKDLSETIEFDQTGKRIRSTIYSSSYNRHTRKRKWIDKINQYQYDNNNRLIKIIDSIGKDSTTFKYNPNGKLTSSRKNLANFVYETSYGYQPFESTTLRREDSIIVYQKTKEYDRDFYVKRLYGYYIHAKLMKVVDTVNGILHKTAFKDSTNLERFNENKTIRNSFKDNGQLIWSDVISIFMNDRVNQYELTYKYYDNGLLKSIDGYVARYFEYEFWK